MQSSFTIFKRGLLLAAIPLVAQAVFIGALIQIQAEAEAAQRWAVHSKEVIGKVEETYRKLLEGYAGIRNLIVSGNSGVADRLRSGLREVPRSLGDLRALVADNPAQQARIDQLAVQSDQFLELLASQERDLRSAERLRAYDQLDLGARYLGAIRTSIDAILTEEVRLDRLRMDRMRRSSSRQVWFLVGGGVAILATTVVLAALFLYGVIKRLTVLRDNARRLAEGTGLKAPLTGRDEIAEVDRAFHEMASSLDQQKQENEMFVYSVSHDLRSPLINLQGFSEELGIAYRDVGALFEREGVPPDVRHDGRRLMRENVEDSIRYIQSAVGRVARIIDAMLRLSRAGRVEYQWQMIDVAPIAQKIIDSLRDTITEKKADVIVDELPWTWGDPTAVEQIFANLIGNAVQYLDPVREGRIEVGSSEPALTGNLAGLHTYHVKDNGLGIRAAYHPRVFTAFSRLQANVQQGEGIGLALVHRMVERLGGKIWMESAAGVGTTFFVALAAGPPAGAPSGNGERPLPFQEQRGDRSRWQPNRS